MDFMLATFSLGNTISLASPISSRRCHHHKFHLYSSCNSIVKHKMELLVAHFTPLSHTMLLISNVITAMELILARITSTALTYRKFTCVKSPNFSYVIALSVILGYLPKLAECDCRDYAVRSPKLETAIEPFYLYNHLCSLLPHQV